MAVKFFQQRVGHMYQILIILAIYKEHMFPVVKAIMTNKTRSLYDAVFTKVKALLPEKVEPTLVLSDYEPALMGGLSVSRGKAWQNLQFS